MHKDEKYIIDCLNEIGNFDISDDKTNTNIANARQAILNTPIQSTGDKKWSKLMKLNLTKMAAAAVILIALIITFNHNGVSPDGATIAWADVFTKIGNIESYSYKEYRTETHVRLKPESAEIKLKYIKEKYYSKEFGKKTESYHDDNLSGQSYFLRQTNKFYVISHLMNHYRQEDWDSDSMDWFAPRYIIDNYSKSEHLNIGRKVIDGNVVEGIHLSSSANNNSKNRYDYYESTLWIDVKTELPFLVETNYKINNGPVVNYVMCEFQWNPVFTAKDFTPVIPDNYHLIKKSSVKKNLAKPQKVEPLDLSYLDEIGLTYLIYDNSASEKIETLANTDIREFMPSNHTDKLEELFLDQDRIQQQWPKYHTVRQDILEQIQLAIDYESLPETELLYISQLLRDKFWMVGGLLSHESYQYGYMARVLCEIAYDRDQHNADIIDELVESIQTLEPTVYTSLDDKGNFIRTKNIMLNKELLELKTKQFNILVGKINNETPPCWQHFACANDLVQLYQNLDNYESALSTVDWIIENADAGGWNNFLPDIKKTQTQLLNHKGFNSSIYKSYNQMDTEDFRYLRTIKSFKGPSWRGRYPKYKLN